MKNYGDVTKINGAEVPEVDIITFGAPCQDLSVAGKRAGMKNVIMGDEETTRSGLFFEAIRIIKEMRDESRRKHGGADECIRPRFAVYENVPGAFSSNHGEDFRAVLEETAKVADKDAVIPGPPGGKWSHAGCIMADGWSIAWRVHDAQFWGVPQRRKRISLVADFAGGGAPEILFEREGVSGNTAESREQGQSSATDVRSGVEETGRAISFQERAGKPGGGKGILIQNERTGALSTLNNQSVCAFEPGAASRVGGHVYENDVAGTVRANAGDNQQAVVYGISAYESNSMKSGNPNSGIYEAETARTLDLNGGSPACNQGGMAVVCLENHPADSRVKISEDGKVQTLSSRMGTGGGNVPMVMEPVAIESHAQDSRYKMGEVNQPLSANMEHDSANGGLVMEPITASKASYFMKQHDDGVAETLVATDYKDPQLVAYGLDRAAYNQGQNAKFGFSVDEEKVGAQTAKGPGAVCSAVDCRNGVEDENVNGSLQSRASNNTNSNNGCRVGSVVRRLTPLECERLQGFPDHWTDIGDWVDSKGKTHKGESDSPRYKALGNSIALPFWIWMARKMVRLIKNDEPTMASLFDGISGFCLAFARAGVKPIFSSEIEEFPIAVAKKHFGDDDLGLEGDYERYL